MFGLVSLLFRENVCFRFAPYLGCWWGVLALESGERFLHRNPLLCTQFILDI
jgi:hypothetical protein